MLIKYLIYPAVGVARIGPANQFYYGPEQTVLAEIAGGHFQPAREAYPPSSAAPTNVGKFRNAAGEILRQAVRFRVYKVWFKERHHEGADVLLPHKAELVNLNAAGVECQWTVKVANKKSFRTADRPDFNRASPSGRVWNVAQGTVSVGGFAVGTTKLEGSEMIAVSKYMLAEIFTDAEGRLVVLAGKGRMDGPPTALAGNQLFLKDWFDDICDGPVECKLKIDGVEKPVERAWIVTGLPRYVPSVPSVVSLYDIALSLANARGQVRFPSKVSFERDVYPILETVVRQRPVSKDARHNHVHLRRDTVQWKELGTSNRPPLHRVPQDAVRDAAKACELFQETREALLRGSCRSVRDRRLRTVQAPVPEWRSKAQDAAAGGACTVGLATADL